MADETYEGWTNRETWAVALHINNDQGWQESVLDALREFVKRNEADYAANPESHDPEYVARSAHGAGEIIRSEVEDVFDVDIYGTVDSAPDCQNFVRTMLPTLRAIGSLWRVNWTELGEAFLDDLSDD